MVFKSIKHLIRQYPLSIVLNFVGLASAFTAFMIICHQANYELSFDTCHPTSGRVYRADKKDDNSMFRSILPRGFSDDIIASSPHIEAGCSFCPFFGGTYFNTVGDDPKGYEHDMSLVTPGFIDVFGIDMVEGNSRSLEAPNSVIIPKSLADLLFHGESALGQALHTDAEYLLEETKGIMTVTGVYNDFPSNTQLNNDLYLNAGHLQEGSYDGANFVCYVLLDEPANKAEVESHFNDSYDFERFQGWLTPIEFVNLPDIYFLNEGDEFKSGSPSQLRLLIAIAILILLVGLINFTNFYIALTPVRMKNINTRLVMGARTSAMRGEIIAESLFWSLAAFAVALILFGPVCRALYSSGLTPEPFSVTGSMPVLLISLAAAVLTGAAAGILPGFYSTSVQPALALKGNFGLSKSGRTMRSILVYVQFVVSFVLLIYILSIERQSQYMKSYPCGFDKERLAVVNIGTENSIKNKDWLKQRLSKYAEIEDVAYASHFIGASDIYSTASADFGGEQVMFSVIYCTNNLPAVMGLRITEGEGFTPTDRSNVLLTENFINVGAEAKSYPDMADVKGFVNDVNITSLRKTESYVAFISRIMEDNSSLPYTYIRLAEGADRLTAIGHIKEALQEMDPVFDYDVVFYSSINGQLYSGEERTRKEIWLFSLLAILLSLVGIWGQTLMDVKYRRKEIAVKRVMGAEQHMVVKEGICRYAIIVGVCFVLAGPIGYLVSERYLSQFARHTTLSPWSFVISLVAVFALAMAVVIYHYLKSTRTNPAEVLKQE